MSAKENVIDESDWRGSVGERQTDRALRRIPALVYAAWRRPQSLSPVVMQGLSQNV